MLIYYFTCISRQKTLRYCRDVDVCFGLCHFGAELSQTETQILAPRWSAEIRQTLRVSAQRQSRSPDSPVGVEH